MRSTTFVAAAIFFALPIVAFGQSDKPNAESSKPTIEDAQKLVDAISADKEKLKVYCEVGKLDQQLDQAEEKGDPTAYEDLVAKRDSLEQQLGPDYIRVIDGLGDIDPNSAEGQRFTAIFEIAAQAVRPWSGKNLGPTERSRRFL